MSKISLERYIELLQEDPEGKGLWFKRSDDWHQSKNKSIQMIDYYSIYDDIEDFEYRKIEPPHSLDGLKVGDVIENDTYTRLIIKTDKKGKLIFAGDDLYRLNELKESGYKKKEKSEDE